MNSSVDNASVNVHECEKCLKLETELLNKKDFVEKEIYDKLFKSFTTLEKHCISLEVDTQLNQEIFKGTIPVFKSKPTGRTFTIVRNACPLTRITTTTEVPLRKPTVLDNEISKPVVTLVYLRKPRKSKTNVPVSKSKVLKYVYANKKEPRQSWGSIVPDVPSSSLDECMSSKLFSGIWTPAAPSIRPGSLPATNFANYYVKGLGHKLISPLDNYGDSNLERYDDDLTIFLLTKASRLKSWLMAPTSISLNFGAINHLVENMSLFVVRLEVPIRRIRTDNGTEFVNQTLREYYEKVGISHETSVARSPQQNGVVERHNRTLIEAAHTMLIYAKAPLYLWVEAVATACYTQNCSIVRHRHGKTPYDLLHDKPPNLSFFHVFGALCYPTNDSENLDFDELTAMASEHISLGPALHEITPATISSGLMPNPPPSTPFAPPSRTNWDILFQPLFDELLTPPPSVDHPAPEVIALIAEVVCINRFTFLNNC
ncbi:retrovirus-related pol polyprotein from transposon TNT 1-94 [Tanacetum coccineum]